MDPILHQSLPEEMGMPRPLPGIAPVAGPWLRVDEAYEAQMALRRSLLDQQKAEVLAMHPGAGAGAAVDELYAVVAALLPGLGFVRKRAGWVCPDGAHVPDAPTLETLGRLCQADFCVLQKADGASEHMLTAAVLCFPASWTLAEKIGRPLQAIHGPVPEYDDGLARRVQRLFDGVQVDRPLWRFNRLWYSDPALFQPRSEDDQRQDYASGAYLRCERQVILRLPKTRAVVFAIHTYLLARKNAPEF